MEAEANVHVLPAGPGLHDSLALLNRTDLSALLSRWSAAYDLVLIDSPPVGDCRWPGARQACRWRPPDHRRRADQCADGASGHPPRSGLRLAHAGLHSQ